jgi:diguanylate cyclase (GGDEF)-like protein
VSRISEASHFNTDIRRLTTTIATAIVFFGLLLLAITAYTGWSTNQTATDIERALVENALNRRVKRVLSEQKSVAWWDDAVTKIADNDLDFMQTEFGIYLTETYGHDEVYILNSEGLPLYARINSQTVDSNSFEHRRPKVEPVITEAQGRKSPLRARPDMLREDQANYQVIAPMTGVARWAAHFVSVDGRPAVVAAMSIVPNVDMNLLKGKPNLVVSVKFIDDAFISEIGRSLLLNDLKLVSKPDPANSIVSEPFVADDDMPIGYLTWTTRRPGQVLLTIILPLVVLAILATGQFAATMFRRLKRASDTLTYEAKHDALSGLPNRVEMVDKIESFLHRNIVKGDSARAVAAYIDIDRFKDVNDTLGHQAGDQLIKLVGQRLQARIRRDDFLSRFGGDEFAILSIPVGLEGYWAIAKRIAQAFESPFSINGQKIRVTASIGLAVAPDNGVTADELMRHADVALYEAKSQGRDCAVLFSPEMAKRVEHRRSIEVDLRAALEDDQFRLNYQPIISCETGAIVGVEALLRWRHPIRGETSPMEFIPIAENAGLLPALGEWVFDQAMKDSKRWPGLEISLNLSPVQFRHVDLAEALRRLATKHDVNPDRFVLEITEGVLLEASEHTNSILESLRAMGFKTALDDFGTRYSSLAYLCNFKFDKIKIDRSFVSRISKDGNSRSIVQSVVRLGRVLGMDIVAEGVENELEATTMIDFGCTEMQGFHFSKPVSAEEISGLLCTSFQVLRSKAAKSPRIVTTHNAVG